MLDDSNILQADAKVIAGVLILLTITYALSPRSEQEVVGKIATKTIRSISWLAVITIIPFSASGILVILGNVFGSDSIIVDCLGKRTITLTALGKYVMISGFGAMAVGISVLLGPKLPKSWVESQKG